MFCDSKLRFGRLPWIPTEQGKEAVDLVRSWERRERGRRGAWYIDEWAYEAFVLTAVCMLGALIVRSCFWVPR